MRKYMPRIINAFKVGDRASEKNISTDGENVYSYNMLIAMKVHIGKKVIISIVDKDRSPSRTTSGHISALRSAFPKHDTF